MNKYVFIAWLSLVAFACANMLLLPRHPWMDEAMLLVNLRDLELNAVAKPLPLYEQAATLWLLLVSVVVKNIFSSDALYEVLKFFSFLAFLFAALITCLTFQSKERPYFSFVFTCLMLSSLVLVTQALTIKQYIWDTFFTSLMLYSGMRAYRLKTLKEIWKFSSIALVCSVLSFVGILTAVGIGTALLIEKLARSGWPDRPFLVAHLGAVLLPATGFLVIKIYFIDPVAELQFSAHPGAYGEHIGGVDGIESSILVLLNLLHYTFSFLVLDYIAVLGNSWLVRSVISLIPVALFTYAFRKGGEAKFVALSAALIFSAVLFLNAMGELPVPYSRHFAFFQPMSLSLLAIFLSDILERARLSTAISVAMILVAANSLILGVRPIDSAGRAQSYLRSEYNPEPDAPIWVAFPAQPAFRYADFPEERLLGMFEPSSGSTSWTVRGGGRSLNHGKPAISTRYAERMISDIAGHDVVWLVFVEHFKMKDAPFLDAAARKGWQCAPPTGPSVPVLRRTSLYLCRQDFAATE
ncbi:hypothetical protein PGB28_17615 [Primorskyibacter aestuariivivens]|uniref:hypothetical protein n=1 Tax=Primorskyibacter aestuariivivens TaxID=1888912 RepID=UPI002301E4AD|nr:hypothetical protein [Primorskyibacter aestuariivivens]MDA7430285.1 hypothetical protein [Primorskyibacter aestuariivivens]